MQLGERRGIIVNQLQNNSHHRLALQAVTYTNKGRKWAIATGKPVSKKYLSTNLVD
jgi:hypothetical protein